MAASASLPEAALMALDAPPAVGTLVWCKVDGAEAFARAKVVEVQSHSEIVVVREGAEGGHVLTVPLRSC